MGARRRIGFPFFWNLPVVSVLDPKSVAPRVPKIWLLRYRPLRGENAPPRVGVCSKVLYRCYSPVYKGFFHFVALCGTRFVARSGGSVFDRISLSSVAALLQ
jgi:hypothetical protein